MAMWQGWDSRLAPSDTESHPLAQVPQPETTVRVRCALLVVGVPETSPEALLESVL